MISRRLSSLWLVFLAVLVAQSVFLMAAFTVASLQTDLRFGGDFVTFWLRARALVEGLPGLIYDPGLFAAIPAQPRALLPGEYYTVFPYPPVFLLYLWPLGFMDLHTAMAVWLAAGFALYMLAVRRSQEWDRLGELPLSQRRLLMVFAALSPLALNNLFTAQTGFLVGALLVAALAWLDRRPWLAGVCFGLLCFKPHMALMAPVALLASRNGRALAGAALTAGCMVALSLLLWGSGLWESYPDYVRHFSLMVERFTNMLTGLNASLFHTLRIASSLEMAVAAQAAVSLLCVACVWKAWSRREESGRRNAVFMCATALATPHMMAYDMTLMIVPVLYLVGGISRGEATRLQKAALVLLLLTFPLTQGIANQVGLPLAFIAVALVLVSLILPSLIPHFKRR